MAELTTKEEKVSKDEFQGWIEDYLSDESGDVEKYMKLADYAEEHYQGMGYDAILRDIAKEEMQHNKHLNEILKDMKDHMH